MKLWIGFVTIFPEMVSSFTEFGVSGQAIKRNELVVETFNPRDFTDDKHRTVDDRPYGGGPGMVFKAEPLKLAVEAAIAKAPKPAKTVMLSPIGEKFNNDTAKRVSESASQGKVKSLILVCGRYEGIDQRFIDACIDTTWSCGDYVLSGGELPAMVVADAIVRLLPGVLGDSQSAEQDSFMTGLLDCPHYTRPEELDGQAVPDVLLSGNHQEIERWRLKQSLGTTWLHRKDLLEDRNLSALEQALLKEFLDELQG
jgi:tRNA (guanine37-N1)-methyltransferase